MVDVETNIAWLSDQPVAFWISGIVIGILVAILIKLPTMGAGVFSNLKKTHAGVVISAFIEIYEYNEAKRIDSYLILQLSQIIINSIYFALTLLVTIGLYYVGNNYFSNSGITTEIFLFIMIVMSSAFLGAIVGDAILAAVRLKLRIRS